MSGVAQTGGSLANNIAQTGGGIIGASLTKRQAQTGRGLHVHVDEISNNIPEETVGPQVELTTTERKRRRPLGQFIYKEYCSIP